MACAREAYTGGMGTRRKCVHGTDIREIQRFRSKGANEGAESEKGKGVQTGKEQAPYARHHPVEKDLLNFIVRENERDSDEDLNEIGMWYEDDEIAVHGQWLPCGIEEALTG